MLVLTHGSPENDAQRQVFAILHELGVGAVGRRGVAVLGDGFARFGPVSGIICTPEAMTVVAACSLSGGDGYLFAPLHGAWTVGGQTAHIDGIGSNPVQEVDLALKRVVASVRRGGLDPGYVQSLIAVHGQVSGVAQPETERGQGVVVAPVEPRQLLEAIDLATVNRDVGLAGAWTTADVTGVLEALGFDCSGLHSQLFTQEGFPYSPYVLRPTSMDDVPFSREETSPGAVRPLRSYAAPPSNEHRETGPVPAVTPPLPTDTPPTATPAGPAALLSSPDDEPAERQRSGWRWLIPLAALLLVGAGVWFGASTLFGPGGAEESANPQAGSRQNQESPGDGVAGEGPTAQTVAGFDFEPGAHDTRTDCAAHAYGDVQDYFGDQPCTGVARALFLTEVEGKPVAVAVAEVTMPDADGAATLKAMTDTSGTGNVNDLLREGIKPEGYPSAEVIVGGEYASSVNQTKVRIVEAAFVDGSDTTAKVDAAADAALQLEL